MKIYTHFSVLGFSNSYLIGNPGGGDAILIDPGVMDLPLLEMIEKNGYYVRHILITHSHESHIRGGNTLLKIYSAEVYGGARNLLKPDSRQVKDGEILDLSGTEVECIEVPGHSSDSLVFRIGSLFFTGDVLRAGGIGATPNRYAQALLINAIQSRLLTYEQGRIFPGHGPPSTIQSERRFNPYLT
jgi:hydroxyacylglutathione hydrolase